MEYVTLDSDDEDIIVPPSNNRSVVPGGAMAPSDFGRSVNPQSSSQSNVAVPVNDTEAGLRSRSNVVPGGAGGAMAPLDFARSVKVNHIPPGTPGISDLPTALGKTYLMRKRARK